MTIIGLDLGTTTGFARLVTDNPAGGSICAQSITLANQPALAKLKKTIGLRALRDYDPRPAALRTWLKQELRLLPDPIKIFFEDVQFAKSLAQAQLWGTLRGAMWTLPGVEFVGVPVQTLKSFAKSGGQDKASMASALARMFPSVRLENADDNQIDAIWLALYGLRYETERATKS